MDYVLMTVVDERDQTLSGPLPTASLPSRGEIVHGCGRIISIQTFPGTPTHVRVKVATHPLVCYTVYQLTLLDEHNNPFVLNVPLCFN
ncbi:MAG: hypothetical protein WC497_02065 [Patescibacteria group bacterium]